MLVTREFTFDAAHHLDNYHGKCERMHGHTYRLQVTVKGEIQNNGMVVDFVLLKKVVNRYVISKLDHQLLNEVVKNPSTERLVIWIWKQLNKIGVLMKSEASDVGYNAEVSALLKSKKDFFL